MPAEERRRVAQQAWESAVAKMLLSAAERGDAPALSGLLDRRANLHARDVDGSTALHVACEEGHTAVVEILLRRGTDVHARNNYGDTALHTSAHHGQVVTTLLLLANGADLLARNKFGKTPSEWIQREPRENQRQHQRLATLVALHVAFALLHTRSVCECAFWSPSRPATAGNRARTATER